MTETTAELSSTDLSDLRAASAPAVSIAWHPEPGFVGRVLELTAAAPVVLGRGADAFGDGALEDRRLSRRHAALALEAGEVLVEDLGSSNGTRLNGQPLAGRARLALGDLLQVGRLLLLVRAAPARFEVRRPAAVVGDSVALALALQQAAAVAPRATTVLLLGETGTGKELFARAIHAWSGRRGRFVAVNCASLADSLLQSEVFGHVRGAFSGAHADRPGLVEEARGGTLFLDEIGDASPAMQGALLRLLQEGEFRRVGGSRTLRADVRVVAATHRELHEAVAAEAFRRDLMTRLGRWIVRLPTLRERLEDVPALAGRFAEAHAGRPMRLSRKLMAALLRHPWPGNVRELDATMERLVVSAGAAEELEVAGWLEEALALSVASLRASTAEGVAAAPVEPQVAPRRYFRGERPEPAELADLLARCGGSVTPLAKRLGISRRTAYRWLEDAGIELPPRRGPG